MENLEFFKSCALANTESLWMTLIIAKEYYENIPNSINKALYRGDFKALEKLHKQDEIYRFRVETVCIELERRLLNYAK